MTKTELNVERLLCAPQARRAQRNATIRIEGERIAAVETSEKSQGKGLIALPALANAHDHARAVKPLALGAAELPLELWLAAITGAPRVDPYLLAALAFGRSALGGAGTIMAHYIRPQGGMTLVEEAREVGRAARRRRPYRLHAGDARSQCNRLWQ